MEVSVEFNPSAPEIRNLKVLRFLAGDDPDGMNGYHHVGDEAKPNECPGCWARWALYEGPRPDGLADDAPLEVHDVRPQCEGCESRDVEEYATGDGDTNYLCSDCVAAG